MLTNDLECTSQAARRAHPLLRSGLALALGRHSEREGFSTLVPNLCKAGPKRQGLGEQELRRGNTACRYVEFPLDKIKEPGGSYPGYCGEGISGHDGIKMTNIDQLSRV